MTVRTYVYPVAEGGVRLEWTITPHEVSLEIDLSQKSGEWHALNLETDVDESRTLNLDDVASWDWMIRRLSEMVGATSRDRRDLTSQAGSSGIHPE